jgi:CRISPR-associated endonuclease/helicase Cas3
VRRGVLEALRDAKSPALPVLVAPTGYGKTSAVHYSWREVLREWGRVVHVLPLRALVSDVASKAVKRGLPLDLVSYQAMLEEVKVELEGRGVRVRKSPYMLSPYVAVTYDSYLLSLYVAPVAELTRAHAHRDVGLLAATGGGVIFDEVHLALATDALGSREEGGGQQELLREEESKAFTALVTTLELLKQHLGRPAVAMTATLQRAAVSWLSCELERRGIEVHLHVCLGRRGLEYFEKAAPRVAPHGLDESYFSLYERYRAVARTRVSKEPVEVETEKALDHSRTVLVFCNTVPRAVGVYRSLKGKVDAEVRLLHGRMGEKRRESVLDEVGELLGGGKELVLVSTQCLEAGVDLDFDTVVTEVAPPGSLVQRAGRAIRDLERRLEQEGGPRVQVVVSIDEKSVESAKAVYPADAVDAAARALEVGERFFDWRFAEEEPSFVDLLAQHDKVKPALNKSVENSLKTMLEVKTLSGEHVETLLKKLDEDMRGSLLRDSALIPLVVYDGEVRDVIPVSLDFLERKGDEVLKMEDKKAVAVFEDGDRRLVKLQRLLETPLSALYSLRRGVEADFLGFLVREDAYDPEVGLV